MVKDLALLIGSRLVKDNFNSANDRRYSGASGEAMQRETKAVQLAAQWSQTHTSLAGQSTNPFTMPLSLLEVD
jgi:hypothetical protein